MNDVLPHSRTPIRIVLVLFIVDCCSMSEVFPPVLRFQGILAAIHRECRGNIFNVLTTQIRLPYTHAFSFSKLITGFGEGTGIGTGNNADAAFIFDFMKKRVKLTGYLLMSHPTNYFGPDWATDWIVEGSNDYKNYQPIHAVQGCRDLLGLNLYSLQTCNESPPFQFIRLRLTAPNTLGNWHFYFGRIEFFGTLVH